MGGAGSRGYQKVKGRVLILNLCPCRPSFQRLMNSRWQWRRELWISLPSLCVSPSLPPSLLPPVVPFCSFSSRVFGRARGSLAPIHLLYCLSADFRRWSGRLSQKMIWTSALFPLFFFFFFNSLSFSLLSFCFSLTHPCSHNAAAAAGAVAASINIVLMFWWLEPARC